MERYNAFVRYLLARFQAVLFAALLASAGCRSIAGYERAKSPAPDAAIDAATVDGTVGDAVTDGAPADGAFDLQPIADAAVCGATSPSPAPGGTIYYYSFDQTPSAGSYPEVLQGGPAAEIVREQDGIASVSAPSGCGRAVAFAHDGAWQPGHLRIPGDLFLFPQGSISVRAKFHRDLSAPNTWGLGEGILCRSADYNIRQPGHICLYRATDGRLVVIVEDTTYLVSTRCSEASIAVDRWVNIGINFGTGGLELFVDGLKQEGTGTVSIDDDGYGKLDCSARQIEDLGIEGNSFFWVIGGTAETWTPSNNTIGEPLNGVVDELSIADFRRPFGS